MDSDATKKLGAYLAKWSCLWWILLMPVMLISQQDYIIDIQHYSTKNGLSHRNVKEIFQDSKGFIWVATQYGLNRFDGHRFKVFSKERNGLANNDVRKIVEDEDGWLWVFSDLKIGKKGHLSLVNIHTLEVQTAEQHFGNSIPFDLTQISGITSSPDGILYISKGQTIYSYRDSQFREVHQFDRNIRIHTYSNENALLGVIENTPTSISFFQLKDRQVIQSEPIKGDFTTKDYLYSDYEGNSWAMSRYATYFLRKNSKEWKKVELSDLLNISEYEQKIFAKIFAQPDGLFWFRDEKKILLFEPFKGVVLDLGQSYPDLIAKYSKLVFFDKDNNAWLSTDFGMFKLTLSKNIFENYLSIDTDEYIHNKTFSCRGIATSNGKLWINGVSTDQFIVDNESKSQEPLNLLRLENKDGKAYKPILRPILKCSETEFYSASSSLFHFQDDQLVDIFDWKSNSRSEMIWTIFQDNNERIWLGTLDNGIGVLEKDSISNYTHYNSFSTLSQSSIYHFLEWDSDRILIASTSGLYVLHHNEGIIKRFWTEGENDYIPADIIHHIHKDRLEKNVIWLATNRGGIIKLKLNPQHLGVEDIQQFTIADGLTNDVVYAIYEDDFGNLWLPSNYGLMRFNKESNLVKTYTTSDGIPFNEFNRISHFGDDDGRLFFGTMNGVTSFYPKDILGIVGEYNKPLRITNFQQFDADTNQLLDKTSDILEKQKITLQAADKYFILEFALLEYKDAKQVKYSYQLLGQSEDWISLDENKLRLSGLPYGKFILNIRAKGSSGQYSTSELSIPIEVLRPFYFKTWFIILLTAVFFLMVWVLQRLRTRHLLKRQIELEKQVQERTATIYAQAEELRSLDKMKSRFFANISHELRTPLTLILAPIQNILKRGQLPQEDHNHLILAKNNGEHLGKMVNQILDLTKLSADKLDLKSSRVVWYNFLRNIIANFDSIADSKQIDFQFEFEGNAHLQVVIDHEKVSTIFNNLLSNAFKFTPKEGKVFLSTKEMPQFLAIEVRDTGQGIMADDIPHIFDRFYQAKNEVSGGTGIGLALVKEYVELMKGEIKVESQFGKGTTFSLTIPKKEIIGQISTEDVQLIEENKNKSRASHILSPPEAIVAVKNEKHSKPKILVVEDNHDLRKFISSLLAENYEVVATENGQEALHKLEKDNRIDLIISDVMMPIMDGFQLLEHLKANTAYHQLPVIMLTARTELEDRLQALRIGVDDYLTKPFIQEELFARIANLLTNAKNRKGVVMEEDAALTATDDISQEWQEWLEEVENKVKDNIGNTSYTLDQLAFDMAIGKRQFARRIKELVGLTPGEYVKIIRFTKARELLESRQFKTVKAVCYSVGFKDVVNFSRQFKERFGKKPSEYL